MTWSARALNSMSSRLFFASLALWLCASPARAEDPSISIELNKTEEAEQGCRTHFLFENRTGHQLNRFQIDLVFFDHDGVYSNQILLDMAPFYKDKKTITSFLLLNTRCDEIGSVLVNDLPACENSAGGALDCLSFLNVVSKSDIKLEK